MRTPNNVIFVFFIFVQFGLVNLWILAFYAAKKVSLRARSIDRPEYEYPEILLQISFTRIYGPLERFRYFFYFNQICRRKNDVVNTWTSDLGS